ncbi:MAG: hypothetical protein AAF497_13640, partial [Planctomycetota bacterium]
LMSTFTEYTKSIRLVSNPSHSNCGESTAGNTTAESQSHLASHLVASVPPQKACEIRFVEDLILER